MELDELDRLLLAELMVDARVSFQELARKFLVSGGTIHIRYQKLKSMGIIKGSKVVLDYEKLGFQVWAYIGVFLKSAKDIDKVVQELESFEEVVEVSYTTGSYGLFIKVAAASMKDLHIFLAQKLQSISEIQSTETFMILDTPVQRDRIS